MKKSLAAITLGTAVSAFSMTIFAQSPMMPPPGGDYPDWVSPGLRGDVPIRRGPETRREPKVIKKGSLAPSRDDRIAFTTLLKEKNSGLIRLLPIELHQTIYNSERNLAHRRGILVQGGPFFSFAGRTHSAGFGSDIVFGQNKISVGMGGVNYGLLTNLGDTPLEAITLSDARLKSVSAFVPPKVHALGQDIYRRITSPEGMIFDELVYRNQLPAESNSTYLLRSIVDRQSDVLVAFRFFRKEHDGSVIIAWKLLKQYPTPRINRTSPRFK